MTSNRFRRAPGGLLTAAFFTACASPALAQKATIVVDDIDVVLVKEAPAPAEVDAATTQPAPAATPATTQSATHPTTQSAEEVAKQRLAKFMQLKFDRRLPTALAAMAATRPVEEEQQFVADVAAGRWDAVAKVIASFDAKSAQQLHRQLLQSLAQGAQPDGGPQRPGQPRVLIQRGGGGGQDPNAMFAVLLPDDVLALSDAATTAPEEQDVNLLGQLLVRSFARGAITDGLVARLEAGTKYFGGPASDPAKRTKAAELLFAAQKLIEAGPFLPPLDAALAAKDAKTLDLHARHLAAVGAEPKQTAALRGSWDVTQAILAIDTAPPDLRDAAIQRALDLMPQLTKQLGIEWLKTSFTDPTKGRAVVAGIGSDVAGNFMNMQVEERTKALTHQRQAVDQLAAVAGPELKHWAPALNLMALAWLQEAEYTRPRPSQKEMNQGPRYDRYGNYMGSGGMQRNNNEPPPVDAEVLLKAAPTDAWIATLDASLAPRVRASIIEMHLKNEGPDAALPLIESLAKSQPKVGLSLSNQLLGVWAKIRNPNEGQQNYNPYGGYSPYGYNPYGSGLQSSGLPLTRTAQVRNLAELHALLERLKVIAPPKQSLDDETVVRAFTSAHSDAEVYRTEDIESVFGPVDAIPIDTLAELLQSMRERLARQWRQLAVQQQAKTKRTDKDVDAEMTRGYELLVSMIEKRLAADANWKLHATLGSALFDWAEFDYGKQVELAVYTKRRDRSFDSFVKAAQLYAAALPKLEEKDETVTVFQQWFNAALGASDLAQLTRQQAPSASQLEQIKQALMGLQPAELRERHVEKFGEGLSESVQSLKPELKPRYLRAGMQIVGDHPAAAEARKLVKYYDDLLTEVALYAQVDGDAVVGHGKPFGLNVGIRHTVAVGRESGGFAKYLQNQQSSRSYYYYGGSSGSGGPKNYRDDFEKKIREALVEGFDIISITYHDEKIEPRGYGRPGWRETPLAYVLLKAKDASVDKVPPIQMDMDFADRQGQVVLPVTSQVLLVDARPESVAPRPITKLAIIQTLDERQAKNGKLTLDVKATANGLVPDLSELLDTAIPGFKVEKVDDQGLSVTKMDAEGDVIAPACERSWIVSLVAEPAANRDAMTFRFPPSKVQGATVSYKRYSDADVIDVEPKIAIAGISLAKRSWWVPAACGLALVAALIALLIWLKRRRPASQQIAHAYDVPHTVNAFSVLELLRKMHRDDRLAPHRAELASAIEGLERTYFAPTNGNGNGSPDLANVAQQWVARSR